MAVEGHYAGGGNCVQKAGSGGSSEESSGYCIFMLPCLLVLLWNEDFCLAVSELPARHKPNIGALKIGMAFWGPLYNDYNRKTQNSIGNYLGPHLMDATDYITYMVWTLSKS